MTVTNIHILTMAAYSNERVAAIVVSVLYRMLTFCTHDRMNPGIVKGI